MRAGSAERRSTTEAILDRVRRALALGPVAAGDIVVVGVSGGPDSLVLLHVLERLATAMGFAVHVAHFDHGLRGAQSASEATHVAEIAERWGLSSTVETAASGSIDPRGRGLQAAARLARYAFLERVATQVGARWIATAHTADDQAETVLMRWVRGAGPSALAGIPVVRDRVIRPLLDVRRAEVEHYAADHGIQPIEDPSNRDPRFPRTQVRREVLPALRALNPRAVEAIARNARLLADDAAYLDAAAGEVFGRARLESGSGWVELSAATLRDVPPALRRRVFRLALASVGAHVERLSLEHIDAAARACTARTCVSIPMGRRFQVDYMSTRILVTRLPMACPPYAVTLPEDGEHYLAGWKLTVRIRHTSAFARKVPLGRWEAAFDSDRLPGILGVRGRYSGDRLFPEGMTGRKRVQDLLVDAKVPRWRRSTVPLLTAGEDVLWVVGLRRDRRYLPRQGGPAVEVEVLRGAEGSGTDVDPAPTPANLSW